MSRQSRMLLVLAIFAVASVVVLAMMARHYGQILDRRQPSSPVERSAVRPAAEPVAPTPEPAPLPASTPAGAPGSDTPSDEDQALRYVDAFINVHRALEQGAAVEPRLTLHRALADAGLDETDYANIGTLYRAWKAGRRDISGPFVAAFEQRQAVLQQLAL